MWFFFFFNCRQVNRYKVPACRLLNFSFIHHVFLFSFLVTSLLYWNKIFGRVRDPVVLGVNYMGQLRADSYDSESRKNRIHRFAFAQRAIDCISSKSQVTWLYILIYEIPSNMMHPVDWKMKENGYLFSTLCLPWDVLCFSFFNKRYCNTSFIHFYNWWGTFLYCLTFFSWLTESHIVEVYWE